jgi:putative glutamine amidotransferase
MRYNNDMQNTKTKNILIAPRHRLDNSIHNTAGEKLISHYLFENTNFLPVLACLDKSIDSMSRALPIAHKYIEIADGLVLLGGGDINPEVYNQENNSCKIACRFRDYFEMALIEKSLEKGIPIFGICRGFQMLNVYFGGTLFQHVEPPRFLRHSFSKNGEEFETVNSSDQKPLHHLVQLSTQGIVFSSLKKTSIDTNSFHHQGIYKLAENFKIEGKTFDGLVEIISDQKNKILATQFHPELDLERNADYKAIFELWLEWVR